MRVGTGAPSLILSSSLSLSPSPFFIHSYLATTSPEDVARVEKQTFVCTTRREDAVPTPAPGVESMLGNWKAPLEMDKEMEEKFRGSMSGMALCVQWSMHVCKPVEI